jgi:Ca-activated chloride channel family protein
MLLASTFHLRSRSDCSGFLRRSGGVLGAILILSVLTLGQNAPTDNAHPTNPPAQSQTAPEQTAPATPAPANPASATDQSQAPKSDQVPSGQESNGQAAGADDPGRFVFRKQVEEVTLHATVVDESGHLVPALDRNAFSVFQNGQTETITSFRREDVPVAIGIVIDNSGSMRDKREKVNQAVLNLIRASNPQDEIFVVNFSQSYYLDQDYTSDVNLLQAALHQMSMKGSTALYDAVVASAVHLKNNPRLDKKALLVITDGQDNMSQETLQEAMHRLQPSNGPTIYAIGLTGSGLTRGGRDALQSLATSTGGVAYFPESLDEVNTITRTVAHDIRSQYTIAYKPANAGAKTGYQKIEVNAKAPGYGTLTVRTRSGYYSGETVR